MLNIGPQSEPGKVDLLADPDYCRFAVHGDVPAAKLLHYIGKRYCAGHASTNPIDGYGHIPGSRDEWAAGAGITARQFAKHAWPRLRCYRFIRGRRWLKDGKVRVWIELRAGFLPDLPLGAVDWRTMNRDAPWSHLKLKSSKPKKIAPVPVPVAAPVVASVPAPSAPQSAPKPYVLSSPLMLALKSQAIAGKVPAPAAAKIKVTAPSAKPPRKSPHVRIERDTGRRGEWIGWAFRAKYALDYLGKGMSFLNLRYAMEEMYMHLREQPAFDDLWLLNEWTYEDDARNDAWLFEVDPEEITHEWMQNNPEKVVPAYFYECGFARMPGTPHVALPKVPVPTDRDFKKNPPPSPRVLLRRFREAAIAAGYRDKLRTSPGPAKNGNNLI